MKKKLLVMLLAFCMVLGMTACGGGSSSGGSGDNILRTAASFAYPSIDVHKEYYGWYTSIYGLSEALFKFDETATAVGCLAESAEADGTTWTIKLKDGVAFSN
jgi:peptide/nickel transport system substrate-binding protein